MELKYHFLLMADYNLRMNRQFFSAAGKLPEAELAIERGAFFGSILGTLNHILVGDLIWLSRFSRHSKRYQSLVKLSDLHRPQSLDEVLYSELGLLEHARKNVDETIKHWLLNEVEETDFSRSLLYKNMKGIQSEKNFAELLSHLFNHQTHHRGQVSSLFNQLGIDVGTTDFLIDIPDVKRQ